MARDPRRCCYLSLASPAGHVASLPAGFQLDGHEPVALHQQHIPTRLGSTQNVSSGLRTRTRPVLGASVWGGLPQLMQFRVTFQAKLARVPATSYSQEKKRKGG